MGGRGSPCGLAARMENSIFIAVSDDPSPAVTRKGKDRVKNL